jgi:hypothetical protein
MTGKLILLGDLVEERELVRDRPLPPEREPEPPRDEREEMRAFIQRERERTDLVRLHHGMDALYVQAGECCDWSPR